MESHARGLSAEEASRKLSETGPNVLFTPEKVTFLDIFWEEVREPMILLLLFVGVVYSIWGQPGDAVTIFLVITLLVLAEVQNEFRAKRAIQRLSELSVPRAQVVRDGERRQIDASGVVPGDLLVLVSGNRVAADGRVRFSTGGAQLDESAITGESFPAEKHDGDEVFAGTVVLSGEAEVEVTSTGKATRLGQVAEGLKSVKPPKTPLQRAMRDLAGKLVWAAVFFSVAIPVIGLLRGQPLKTMVLTGLSLSFATIPEELPIIITMVLGLGSYRLSKSNFLVKRLEAAETLGAVDVIVTDKTGTLTESRMTLVDVHTALPEADALAAALAAVAPYEESPLDTALKRRAGQAGLHEDVRRILREREIGDGSKTKAVLREGGALYVSGAPEEVFAKCVSVPEEVRSDLERETAAGRRDVAVARRPLRDVDGRPWDQLERELEFVALMSFSDPPRPQVPEAIARTRDAGVRTIMVTGDHPATAEAIAKEVGMPSRGGAVLGADIDRMEDSQLRRVVEERSVFARTTPQHKYRIVKALQDLGHTVAVTGDGINDALALQGADVGIAMGVRGTDVAKDAAQAVLADDDYVSIAHAMFEGRVFYDNLRKGVKYYLSVKVALIAVFLLPVLLGLPLPFSPVQIILLELFMDLAASAGFVAEPAEPDVKSRPPVPRSAQVFDARQVRDIFLKGAWLFAAVIAVYLWARSTGMGEPQVRTLAFASWMVGNVALAFVSRSDRQPLARVGLLGNRVVDLWALAVAAFLAIGIYVPIVASYIGLAFVPPADLLGVAALVIVWISLLETRKYLRRAERAAPAESV